MSDQKNLEKKELMAKSKLDSSAKSDVAGETKMIVETANIASEISETVDLSESVESGEGFSEDEKKRHGSSAGQIKRDDQKQLIELHQHLTHLPSEKIMRKKVVQAIRREIRREERKVLLVYGGFKSMPPHNLVQVIARIRELRNLLASILTAAKEALIGFYFKWVQKTSQ